MAEADVDPAEAKLDPIFQPVAPNHPIVISCVNGGFFVDYQDLDGLNEEETTRTKLDQRRSNFFIPPFAPVFTPRQPTEFAEGDRAKGLPLVVANTRYINDEDWKFLGIAFTGCTIDEALRLAMAPPKTSHGNRVAVIVGGSCTVSAPHNTELRVTNTIKFSARENLTLNAEGIPPIYRQAYPVTWTYRDQMDNRGGPQDGNHDLVVHEGETTVYYTEKEHPIFLAGVVLDTGPTGDLRILLK